MQEKREAPIFIGGTGRSGTTILSLVLDQHPDVFSTNAELKLIVEPYGLVSLIDALTDGWGATQGHIAIKQFKFFTGQLYQIGFTNPLFQTLGKFPLFKNHSWIVRKFPAIGYSAHGIANRLGETNFKKCVQELLDRLIYHIDTSKPIDTYGVWDPFYITNKFSRAELLAIFRLFLRDLYSAALNIYGKKRWCDDTPANLVNALFLLELYPEMKLIHMLRDPRDVVASYCNQGWASNQVAINSHLIQNVIKGWLDLRPKLPPENFLEVRLEDLTQYPETTLNKICEFANLEFSPSMLTLDLSASHTGRFEQELNVSQIQRIETGLKDWMIEKAYL